MISIRGPVPAPRTDPGPRTGITQGRSGLRRAAPGRRDPVIANSGQPRPHPASNDHSRRSSVRRAPGVADLAVGVGRCSSRDRAVPGPPVREHDRLPGPPSATRTGGPPNAVGAPSVRHRGQHGGPAPARPSLVCLAAVGGPRCVRHRGSDAGGSAVGSSVLVGPVPVGQVLVGRVSVGPARWFGCWWVGCRWVRPGGSGRSGPSASTPGCRGATRRGCQRQGPLDRRGGRRVR